MIKNSVIKDKIYSCNDGTTMECHAETLFLFGVSRESRISGVWRVFGIPEIDFGKMARREIFIL